MSLAPSFRDALIEQLCADHLVAGEAGNAPDRATWLGTHPELAVELGEFLDCLHDVGRQVAPLRLVAGADMTIDHHAREFDPGAVVVAPAGYEILGKMSIADSSRAIFAD
jgi:hypothetical protein